MRDEKKQTAAIIRLPLPVLPYPEARSDDLVKPQKRKLADVVPLRSLHPRTQGGFDPFGTTSQRVGRGAQGLGPSQPENPKSQLCPEALALHDSIMDYKSMQPWITEQLTPCAEARRIAHVSAGRPKEPVGPAAYRAAFIKRVRAARALYTDNPPEMAKALGVERDTYYRYEKRLMMPHHLIPEFCRITGVTITWLLEGPSGAKAMHHQLPATGTDTR